VAGATRSVDEIIARVVLRRSMMHPSLRGLWLAQGVGAVCLALLLLVDYFEVPLPLSFDFLSPAGPPLRVLLLVPLGAVAAAAAYLVRRHEEPPYPQLAQSAALGLASVGALAAAAGVVVYLLWRALVSVHFPGAAWVEDLYPVLLLGGAGALMGALPALAASAIRPFVADRA
jgi:hypothetical protein